MLYSSYEHFSLIVNNLNRINCIKHWINLTFVVSIATQYSLSWRGPVVMCSSVHPLAKSITEQVAMRLKLNLRCNNTEWGVVVLISEVKTFLTGAWVNGRSCFCTTAKWIYWLHWTKWLFTNNYMPLTQPNKWCCPWQQDFQNWPSWLLLSSPLSANVTSGSINCRNNCKLSKKFTSLTEKFSSRSTNNYHQYRWSNIVLDFSVKLSEEVCYLNAHF